MKWGTIRAKQKVNVGQTQVWLTIDGTGKRIKGGSYEGAVRSVLSDSIGIQGSLEVAKEYTYKEAKNGFVEISATETIPLSRIYKIEFETTDFWIEA